MQTHTKHIQVKSPHLDRLNHVNNTQYVRWVEMMAEEHWEKLKYKTVFYEDYWVMVEHHIQYKKQAFLNDNITVITWPLEPEGIKQPRIVEFRKGEEILAISKTYWVLIDHNTNKIKRLQLEQLTYLD